MGGCESKERKKESSDADEESRTALAVGALVVLAAGAIYMLLVSGGKKMMKAPGRDGFIPRDGFERDPRAYFRDLRKGN
ncbi:hypothetical protein MRB53_024272 [Persea americana]|uniref:Uncharacterized protein n=1 Tax=Persea americana TaxID=3435 RepID=A0ACC2LC03_PERAE|nr:hypothetical protein MRB53_024272 [Persea americana]